MASSSDDQKKADELLNFMGFTCPDCYGQGWYPVANRWTGAMEQEQCQRCNCTGILCESI